MTCYHEGCDSPYIAPYWLNAVVTRQNIKPRRHHIKVTWYVCEEHAKHYVLEERYPV